MSVRELGIAATPEETATAALVADRTIRDNGIGSSADLHRRCGAWRTVREGRG